MHRVRRRLATAATALAVGSALAGGWSVQASAQQALNLERDCKVLRTCNFTRNGQPRGCLSSYTCRTCKMVPVKCNIGGRTKCQEFICSWGG